MASSTSWEKIFETLEIHDHNFDQAPFILSAEDIKRACQDLKTTGEKEVRILCKQDTRESRPDIFKKFGLFLLPIKNGRYAIIKGEGYVDIPPISDKESIYRSKLDFPLMTSKVGDSEMQHLDYAYASSLIRTFVGDPSLVLTIRGRKFTPDFDLSVGGFHLEVSGVQTEVDAGYEGADQIVLIEAKNFKASNVIIRQLYYPFRQWQSNSDKKVTTLFFEKSKNQNLYSIWQFGFSNPKDYNSINVIRAGRYRVEE